MNYLRAFALVWAVVFILQAADKGNKFFKQGEAAEQKKDWDRALDLYQQALDLSPNNPAYMISVRRARFQAGQVHVNLGQQLRSQGKLEEALGEFQKALIADPSSAIAIQEMRRVQGMLDRNRNQQGANLDDRRLTPVERARRDTDLRVTSILSPPELKPVVRQVGPLKMNNQPPRVLYETVGKLAGVNVLFDSQYSAPARNFNAELTMGTAEEALDYLAVLTHTFWKPLTGNTIFVTDDNPTKHRDYDDEVVRTFYLTNVTSVQEFQEVATAIRTVTDIRRVFTYNAQKAMVVRGTLDAVALAEKLVHDLDKPKSEVIVDVIVMQANSERTKNLAATIFSLLSSGLKAGLNVPITFTPQNGIPVSGGGSGGDQAATTSTAITLNQVPHVSIHDFSTTLPGALLQALATDTNTKVLNRPQIRASDGQKANLKIGNRIPYATGSFQPGVGTVGVSPLVSTQFNYADVGVNLEITPQVHSADELTLHIDVEVSSVSQYIDLGGIQQPVIGQNKSTADIRLHEGEINILGGLSSSSDATTLNGLPFLTNIPVLGKFAFGNSTSDKANGELLIALIPHIVRTPDYSDENLRGVYAGNDQTIKLNYAPRPEPAPAAPPATQPTAPQTPPAPGQARVSFSPATLQAAVSSTVTVTIQVDNVTDLAAGSPIKVKFDPMQLRLNDISPGDLWSRDGVRVTPVKDIRNDTGEATLTVSRASGSPGVSGSGAIATLNFVAVGKGSSTVRVADSVLRNPQQQALTVTLGELPVTIQ